MRCSRYLQFSSLVCQHDVPRTGCLMMSLRTTLLPLTLITLISTLGESGNKWSMKYSQDMICALKGTTVFMNGTYTHPHSVTVTEAFWYIDPVKGGDTTSLLNLPEYSNRVQFYNDTQQHFSLRLTNVTKEDEHQYCFRVETHTANERWAGIPGINLKVTDLHVDTSQAVIEGNTTDLTCTTTCSLTNRPTFIWYKNGHPLSSSTNSLHLQSVSSEDAGSYRCAVRGYEHLPSLHQTLTVTYPPKNVSVSISPSGEIVENSSVTLSCSSDANPPVLNYTWFKEGGTSPVGSGQSYSITNIIAEHTGLYYCVAQNEHGALNGTVTITVKIVSGFPCAALGAAAGAGCVVLIVFSIFLIRYKRRVTSIEDSLQSQTHGALTDEPKTEDIYANLGAAAVASTVTLHTDTEYASIRCQQSPAANTRLDTGTWGMVWLAGGCADAGVG
ncbi:B-cell receptor CD22-like isoform X2 [Brachyhypopomus gauderio]|uniref:B-cell receptor CD22-like isoform X2 n=1 Tax=Brachyhypopomus gauderio TaxID=698409 RepID=UPI004040FEF8